jgi:hypothetical protein
MVVRPLVASYLPRGRQGIVSYVGDDIRPFAGNKNLPRNTVSKLSLGRMECNFLRKCRVRINGVTILRALFGVSTQGKITEVGTGYMNGEARAVFRTIIATTSFPLRSLYLDA